ncbi:hypothetical protein MRX96_011971 [Rhipicephalus microplus]
MGKLQPFYNEISKCFRQFGVFNESLSIDESMVPYYEHHSCKMFICGKPIRFGYNIWMMCSSNGYPYAMEIYFGRNEKDDKTPLGIRVFSNIVSVLGAPEHHEVYFDNFFTSHGLLTKLADQGDSSDRDCARYKNRWLSTEELEKHRKGRKSIFSLEV